MLMDAKRFELGTGHGRSDQMEMSTALLLTELCCAFAGRAVCIRCRQPLRPKQNPNSRSSQRPKPHYTCTNWDTNIWSYTGDESS